MIKRALIVLLVLPGIAHAVICKTVDAEGVVSYSDVPAAECRDPVRLPPSSTYEPRPLPASQPTGRVGLPVNTSGYQSIQIEQPADKGTVRSNLGQVAISIGLEPPLQEGDRVTIYLDGRAVPGSFDSLAIELSGVDRGTHTLGAEVRNQRGQRLIESSTISFTLRKTSVDAEPTQPIEPPPPNYDPDYAPDPSPDDGVNQIPKPTPRPNPGSSSTPGRTNPAFKPNYRP